MKTQSRYSLVSFAWIACILAAATLPTQAVPVTFESAAQNAVDPTRVGGYVVGSSQFLGWRFELTEPTTITTVGGNFTGNGVLFAALISLDGPGALPHGEPFTHQEVLVYTTFQTLGIRKEPTVQLSASLNPGIYGLVFGSGLFGADGYAVMSYLAGNPLSDPGYFRWDTSNPPGEPDHWVSGGSPIRFVVQGFSARVPDPSPGLAGLVGLLVVAVWSWNVQPQRQKTL